MASPPRPYRSHTHMAERMRLFDRYSNTLLVSLNNRISIRDAYSARGGVANQAVPPLMGQPVAETEVKDGKSHDRHVMVPISS
jgi:hypothetical protein